MISTSVSFLNERVFRYELKSSIYKYVHDNIFQQLNKNTMSSYREVENLYLLISLTQIGREYWLAESELAHHFLITENETTKLYERQEFMNIFSITVLLSYVKDKKRYAKIRSFVEAHVINKFQYVRAQCHSDAETIMIFLDLLVCPYVSRATKQSLGAVLGISPGDLAAMEALNSRWFTLWGDKFNLTKELDAKRSREVY